MKTIILIALSLAYASVSFAKDTYVKPYTDKNGRYVPGHHRSTPNETKADNYSTYGNTNPYNGKEGKKKYDYDEMKNEDTSGE